MCIIRSLNWEILTGTHSDWCENMYKKISVKKLTQLSAQCGVNDIKMYTVERVHLHKHNLDLLEYILLTGVAVYILKYKD